MTTATKIGETLQELINDIELKATASGGGRDLAGIETGFHELDRITSEMPRGSLIVIASRPSMGKTALALNIASHVFLKSQLPVLMISLKLSAMQITARLVSQVGKINLHKIQSGKLTANDKKLLGAAAEKLKDAKFYIDESPAQLVEEVELTCRDIVARVGRLGLIVVDDLQSMEPINAGDGGSDNYERVMSSLKSLARKSDTPVILLSQLTQQLEESDNNQPRISDLPDRTIALHSDLLIFLNRGGLYDASIESMARAELIIGRHRFGETGMIVLGVMNWQFGQFSNRFEDQKNGQ